MRQLLFSLSCPLSGHPRQVASTGRRLRGDREEGNVSKSTQKLGNFYLYGKYSENSREQVLMIWMEMRNSIDIKEKSVKVQDD